MTFLSRTSGARLMAASLFLAAAGPALAETSDNTAVAVRQVVMDIVSYTRWPDPQSELRFCIVGAAQFAAAFAEDGLRSGTVSVRTMRMGPGDDMIGTACDVVYEGPLLPAEREAVVQRLAGHPVLVIGEPALGCIEVTMFCLAIRGDQVSFASNLDAIARSGVRLNPRVLLLGRRQGNVR